MSHAAILKKELFQSHVAEPLGQEHWASESPVNVSHLRLLLFCTTPFTPKKRSPTHSFVSHTPFLQDLTAHLTKSLWYL